jgi:AbiTii
MASIVEKLQRDALNSSVPVSDLLRRVKFAAAKLGLGAVEDWVDHELKGYEVKPPDYRKVHGRPMSFNPYRGWLLMGGYTDRLSWMRNPEPVSVLEDLVRSCSNGGALQVSYPDAIKEMLNKQNGVRGWNYCLEVSPSELGRILDRVRTLILEWALELEKAGIVGTEDNFGPVEKQKAQAASTTINIGHIGSFVGNLGQGNASGDIDASGTNIDQLLSIVSQLRAHQTELLQAGADASRLEEKLSELEKAIANGKHGLIRGLLTDVRNAISGATGNLIATGAINVLNGMLGTGVPSP